MSVLRHVLVRWNSELFFKTAWIQVAKLLKDPDNPDFKDSTASIPTCYTHSNLLNLMFVPENQ